MHETSCFPSSVTSISVLRRVSARTAYFHSSNCLVRVDAHRRTGIYDSLDAGALVYYSLHCIRVATVTSQCKPRVRSRRGNIFINLVFQKLRILKDSGLRCLVR